MKYVYKSVFRDEMHSYLDFRSARNLQVNAERLVLNAFDRFLCSHHLRRKMLSAELFEQYEAERACNAEAYRYMQNVTLRHFCDYLRSRGFDVCEPSLMHGPKHTQPHPHIYSDDELKSIFRAIDRCKDTGLCIKHRTDPVMFRMIYGCGLRASEATGLKTGDIDLRRNCIIIRHSKNDKSRVIPFAVGFKDTLKQYLTSHSFERNSDNWLFPTRLGTRISSTQMDLRFRDYLTDARIPLSAQGPRIHDLRHTFAVNCLRRWVLQKVGLTNALPYLSAYMGHTSCVGTEYYLRLTATMYPDILSKIERSCASIIPERRRSE